MLTTKDEKIPEKSGVGIIVARFQVPELTNGHIDLINSVKSRHNTVIVLLGTNGAGSSTKNNPLDFHTRQLMVNSRFADVRVAYIKDCFCDDLWSRSLDGIVSEYVTIGSEVTLYGSRDSFTSSYTGRFSTKILESESAISGTEVRKSLKQPTAHDTEEFRQGAIWATQNQYPTAYPVIDVAIINEANNTILLGKKENETLWRLPGGFADPKKGFSENALEDTVKREAFEETSLEVADVTYLGSFFVDDWRYRSEADSMMSVLFKAKYTFGAAKAGDDLIEVKWFPLNSTTKKQIGPKSHSKMFDCILKSTKGKHDDTV